MRAYLDCIPCFLSQSLEACRFVSEDVNLHFKVLKEVMNFLQEFPLNKTPPEISKDVHRIVRETLGCKDPYEKVKKKSNEIGNKIYPELKKIVSESEDPLKTAIKISIAGNAIDFGTTKRFDIKEVLDKSLKVNLDEEALRKFRKDLDKSKTILYLSDNAGEVFFDRILIEELKNLGKKITYAVKSNPIINDATIIDAKFAGIDEVAEVIEGDRKGCSAPGFVLDNVSEEFLRIFKESDIIISKGQGNYEALSNVKRRIYFLLLIKCKLVARDIGKGAGEFVMKVIN